jgi:hypothetical protein
MNKKEIIDLDERVKYRVGDLKEEDLIDLIRKKLMRLLEKKYEKDFNLVTIFEIHPIRVNKKEKYADILVDDIKSKKKYSFEIQRGKLDKWTKELKDFYTGWEKELSNSNYKDTKVIMIPLDKILKSTTLEELDKILRGHL